EPDRWLVLDGRVRRPREGAHALSPASGRQRLMRSLLAVLGLVVARARRRPGAWLAPALGIALAAAFAAAVAAEGTIAGDQAARTALSRAAPLDRTVRVTWQGTPTASAL